jgi:hypothetical protein
MRKIVQEKKRGGYEWSLTTFSREKLAKGLSGNGKRKLQRFHVF